MSLCANIIDDGKANCSQPADKMCKQCGLVKYCSQSCQKSHWTKHKVDCKSPLAASDWKTKWDMEGRLPRFKIPDLGSYLLDDLPAVDICKLSDNEGSTAGDLSLLFAAAADLGDAIFTVNQLPEEYKGFCTICINSIDKLAIARNIIILLAAFTIKDPELIIHLWYSAFLKKAHLDSLRSIVLPLLQDICHKIRDKNETTMLNKTWSFGSSHLHVSLLKKQWFQLLQFFHEDLTRQEATRIRSDNVLDPIQVEMRDHEFLLQEPYRRVARERFEQNGLLLPFGACTEDFITPNPTLFHKGKSWPVSRLAIPLLGWHVPKIESNLYSDVYGNLYGYLHRVIGEFMERVDKKKFDLRITGFDSRQLKEKLPIVLKTNNVQFDRIMIPSILDGEFPGPKVTLDTFSTMINSKVNPKATILVVFKSAIIGQWTHHDMNESMKNTASFLKRRYSDFESDTQSPIATTSCRLHALSLYFMEMGPVFDRVAQQTGVMTLVKAAGLQLKSKHTIIEPFPYALSSLNPSKEELIEVLAGGPCGIRYMELVAQT